MKVHAQTQARLLQHWNVQIAFSRRFHFVCEVRASNRQQRLVKLPRSPDDVIATPRDDFFSCHDATSQECHLIKHASSSGSVASEDVVMEGLETSELSCLWSSVERKCRKDVLSSPDDGPSLSKS